MSMMLRYGLFLWMLIGGPTLADLTQADVQTGHEVTNANSGLDSDSDGLTDIDEAKLYNTDSQLSDTDTDGLQDGEEIMEFFTHPLIADSDGDGYLDGVEVKNGSDPLEPSSIPSASIKDLDGDGLLNTEEKELYHTDEQRFDTDFDGLSDSDEVYKYLSDALTVDSDGDSFWDGEEVSAGTDPTDPEDFPK
ncbi:MAG: binary toxin-like calcium binding domain-containing protein [Thiohalomonadales bacterium]